MGFRGSNGTSHKTKKLKGRWDKRNFKKIGETYVCPNCANTNSEPLRNSNGLPYCSSCLVKTGNVFFMKKRNVVNRQKR
jgi:ribosomal protein L37AE/L43A